jgi:hypothetical protein
MEEKTMSTNNQAMPWHGILRDQIVLRQSKDMLRSNREKYNAAPRRETV